MHRANLVERKIGRPGSPQTKPTKRVVSASRFAKRDPTATSAKRPRRNARRSTAFVANERGQRKAPRSVVLRRDDSLVANPTRSRINQLERRLDDAPKRPPFSVRLRFRSRFQYPFLYSFATTRSARAALLFRPLYRKKRRAASDRTKQIDAQTKNLRKEKSRPRLSPLPNAADFGYNAKRRYFAPSNGR